MSSKPTKLSSTEELKKVFNDSTKNKKNNIINIPLTIKSVSESESQNESQKDQSLIISSISSDKETNNVTNITNNNVESSSDQREKLTESDEDPDFYEVEDVVGKKKHKGKVKYLVKWLGYPSDQNTWEPLENLTEVMNMVTSYEELCKLSESNLNKKKKGENKASNLNNLVNNLNNATDKNNLEESQLIDQFINQVKKPEKVTRVNYTKYDMDRRMMFNVDWETQEDGTIPEASWITHEEIKSNWPYVLIEFYEARIHVKTKNNTTLPNNI